MKNTKSGKRKGRERERGGGQISKTESPSDVAASRFLLKSFSGGGG